MRCCQYKYNLPFRNWYAPLQIPERKSTRGHYLPKYSRSQVLKGYEGQGCYSFDKLYIKVYWNTLLWHLYEIQYLPFNCLKSYCSVLSRVNLLSHFFVDVTFLIIKESEAEKSATVPEYSSPSKKKLTVIQYDDEDEFWWYKKYYDRGYNAIITQITCV